MKVKVEVKLKLKVPEDGQTRSRIIPKEDPENSQSFM